MNGDMLQPQFRKEYGEMEARKLEKRVDRIDEIKERWNDISSENVWCEQDKQHLRNDFSYLLSLNERYKEALTKINSEVMQLVNELDINADKKYLKMNTDKVLTHVIKIHEILNPKALEE